MPAANLTPFVKGDGRAVEAGRRGGMARAAAAAAKREGANDVVANLRTLARAAEGEDLPSLCIGVAVQVLGRIAAGKVPVRHAGDAAELLRALVDVARAASGAAGSVSTVVHLSASDARARLAELAAVAGGLGDVVDSAPASSSAVAADDPQVVDGAGAGGGGGGARGGQGGSGAARGEGGGAVTEPDGAGADPQPPLCRPVDV